MFFGACIMRALFYFISKRCASRAPPVRGVAVPRRGIAVFPLPAALRLPCRIFFEQTVCASFTRPKSKKRGADFYALKKARRIAGAQTRGGIFCPKKRAAER